MTALDTTILIVDDQPMGRDSLQILLENQGYHLMFADSGPAMLETASQFKPDLILLDVMMPDMDGFEACQRLRATPPLADVPVIMVTALDDRQSRIRGLEAGANDFISKPVDRTELRARVRTITHLNAMRQQHLQELELERDRIRAILNSLREAVVVTGPDGVIQFANPAATTLTGFTHPQLIGQNWRIWHSSHQSPDFYAQVEETVKQGGTWHGEVIHRRQDGSQYDALLSVTPLFDPHHSARLIGMVSVQLDITPLKEAERMKGRFISNVSHELNTPLSVIILHAENLKALYPQLTEADRHRMIDDIHKHANHLDHLIGDVMALTRLDSELAVAPQSLLNLNQLLKAEVDRQLPLAREKQQHLSLHLAEPMQLEGNPEQLQQIFSNLLSNAIKYTQPGGQITCEARPITLPARDKAPLAWPGLSNLPSGNWAACRVSDTGPGIAAEHLPRLFERFYRVKTEQAVRGSGLGLSIVQEMVDRHHGQVALISTPGQGTTVAVFLPLSKTL